MLSTFKGNNEFEKLTLTQLPYIYISGGKWLQIKPEKNTVNA